METQRDKEGVMRIQFDELAKTLADGLTRRRTLQLLSGSVAGVLGMPKTWGAPWYDDGKGKEPECSQICASFSGDLTAFNACKKACEDCRECKGKPAVVPVGGPNRQICICGDGFLLNTCASLDCTSSAAQDAICGPACAAHGGEAGTGCITADPTCVGPFISRLTCIGATPCRTTRGEAACC